MLSYAHHMLIANCGRLTCSRSLPDQLWYGGSQRFLKTRLLIAVSIRMAEQIFGETSTKLVIATYNL